MFANEWVMTYGGEGARMEFHDILLIGGQKRIIPVVESIFPIYPTTLVPFRPQVGQAQCF